MTQKLKTLADIAVIVASLSAAAIVVLLFSQRFIGSRPGTESASAEVIDDWEQYASTGHRIGSETPAVTIVEFGDYQCPYCREWQPHIEAMLRKYPDDVAFVYRHFPLAVHDLAYSAARAAECAGKQGRFWPFHREILGDPNWLGDAIKQFAVTAGVQDMAVFDDCLADESPVPAIEEDLAAAMKLGARGTPTILINGVMSYGVVDSIRLETAIQQAIP